MYRPSVDEKRESELVYGRYFGATTIEFPRSGSAVGSSRVFAQVVDSIFVWSTEQVYIAKTMRAAQTPASGEDGDRFRIPPYQGMRLPWKSQSVWFLGLGTAGSAYCAGMI